VAAGFDGEPPSPPADDVELDPESDFALELEVELDPELESLESDAFEVFGVRVAARSFFAQPEPLNRIAGLLMPFRRVPWAPQFGQNVGPGSLIPWTTSVRWPQLEQT